MLFWLICNKKYFNVASCFLSPFKSKYHLCDYLIIYLAKYACTSKLSWNIQKCKLVCDDKVSTSLCSNGENNGGKNHSLIFSCLFEVFLNKKWQYCKNIIDVCVWIAILALKGRQVFPQVKVNSPVMLPHNEPTYHDQAGLHSLAADAATWRAGHFGLQ